MTSTQVLLLKKEDINTRLNGDGRFEITEAEQKTKMVFTVEAAVELYKDLLNYLQTLNEVK